MRRNEFRPFSSSLAAATLLIAAAALSLGPRRGAAEPGAAGADDASSLGEALRTRVILPATTVHAGDGVELRWKALPGDIEEMEILLSVDGGEHYGLRVTPECDPHSGRFVWRVPNLPTSGARLRLRFGIAGREIEAEPGECFTIVGDPEAPPGGRGFHENGWWSGLEEPGGVPQSGLAAPRASLQRAAESGAAEAPPRGGAAIRPRDLREERVSDPPVSPRQSLDRGHRPPRMVPLRN